MKTIIASLMLGIASMSAQAADNSFADLLARVTARNPVTQAIEKIDKHLEFQMEQKGDQVQVTIWKNMKVRDPNQETYLFAWSDVIRQEYARLQFQAELNNLISRCAESEQHFRISQYKKHPIRAGMPYDEARKLLQDDFQPDGLPRAEEGAYRLESETHSIIFRHGVLIDVITKDSSDGK